ncbi:rhomboid family intramembrane serine protease [Candidatus Pacearchaeota archaeon]|nr:rhomboid family intramembrane serine protease [Candidatus Pacearchaeota archaeon]MBI2057001.1 rhomboid family intramembrane serine protease [Candidatus Pacearchaeota archaeon]
MGNLDGKKSFFSSLSINTILILLTILMFFVFSLLIKFNVLTIDDVALKPSNILQGKYLWTFLTSMFMHGGFFHLFVNMFSLFFLGTFLQRILGQKRYLWFYLISGLFAGIFFVLASLIPIQFFSADFNLFAVGASGALFGLIGLMMLLTPNLPVYIMFIPIPIKIKYAAPGMLVLLWLISVTGNISIGNTAHLGGLISGLISGFYLRNRYKNKVKALNKFFR